MGLIDGTISNGWASPGRKPFPHSFILELAQAHAISAFAVDNRGNDEPDYPGISVREVTLYGSLESAESGYKEIVTMEVQQARRTMVKLVQPVSARWLRLEVKSNHGHPMHTEIMELEAFGRPLGDSVTHADPSGIYVTNYGRLLLSTQGTEMEGCYEMDTGYVSGTVDGRYIRADWREHKGSEFGTAELVLSASGDFLNGLWYEDGELQGPWFGSREVDGQGIACDPRSAAEDVKLQRPR